MKYWIWSPFPSNICNVPADTTINGKPFCKWCNIYGRTCSIVELPQSTIMHQYLALGQTASSQFTPNAKKNYPIIILYSFHPILFVPFGRSNVLRGHAFDAPKFKSKGMISNIVLLSPLEKYLWLYVRDIFGKLTNFILWLFKTDKHFGTSQIRNMDKQNGPEGV